MLKPVITKRLIHLFGAMLAVTSLAWFIAQIWRYSGLLRELSWGNVLPFALSIFLYLGTYVLSGASWYYLMRATDEKNISIGQAIVIGLLAQIGKYAPGNIAHHLGRVLLAKRAGFSTHNTLFTMFIEVVFAIAVTCGLALVTLLLFGATIFEKIPYVGKQEIFVGGLVLAVIAPFVLYRLLLLLGGVWARSKNFEFSSLRFPSLGVMFVCLGLYIVNYILVGLVILVIAAWMFDIDFGNLFLVTGIFAVSWIVGFVTPGAPAGLGVREIILVTALTPLYTNEVAVGVAAVLRLVTVFGDGIGFLLGLALRHHAKLSHVLR